MTNRIPPSLSWLVNKRSRIHGEIVRLKNEKKEFLSWSNSKLKKLIIDLDAIDRTLSLHEIKITPNIIPPTQSRPINQALKYGELSKLIIESITNSKDGFLNVREVVSYVATKKGADLDDLYTSMILVDSITNRIKNLCNSKKLKRLPKINGSGARRYSLSI